LICIPVAIAQEQYKGTVKNREEEPIASATVRNPKSSSAYTTDSLGRFSNLSEEQTVEVVIRAVGYQSKNITLRIDETPLEIILDSTNNVIEEVLVNTGYSILPKERATGSFAYVGSAERNTMTTENFLERLEGKVAGLQFDNRSGTPLLNVRGLNTFSSGSSKPLIVVDNFPYDG